MQKFSNVANRRNRDNDVDDDIILEELIVPRRPKNSFTRVLPVRQHNFYLYSEIGPPDEYIDLIQTIRTAEPHDQITLHLNTVGGYLDTGIAIISAIAECQGTITTVLDGTACSMGAILFLAGHQYMVHDCSMLMFHTFNGGFIGKSSDVDKQVQAYKRQYTLLINKTCSKFLTADEIKRIAGGEEMWFASDVISKRLKVLHKSIMEEAQPKPTKPKRVAVDPVESALLPE